MKILFLMLAISLLVGCGGESTPASVAKAAYAYPALNESSLPPAPPQAKGPDDPIPPEPPAIPMELTDNGGLQMEIEKMELIEHLRAYAAQAGPDDPFAMTEEDIEEFSKLDNPRLQ